MPPVELPPMELPGPAPDPTLAPAEERKRAQSRTESFDLIAANKNNRRSWRPSLEKFVRLSQLTMVIIFTLPILYHYDHETQAVCPYATICSKGLVEVGLLLVSKTTALLMYPLIIVVFFAKCSTLRSLIQQT
jgi:hypothetical protein